jgi:hypothetical protein
MRKATFFDYANFKLYLESAVGLNEEQAKTVFTASFELGRITMIIGFLAGLAMGAWIL